MSMYVRIARIFLLALTLTAMGSPALAACLKPVAQQGKMLFLSRRPGGANDKNYDLFRANLNGTQVEQVTDYPDRSIRWYDLHKPTGRIVMAYSFDGDLSVGPSGKHGATRDNAAEQVIGWLEPGAVAPLVLIDTRNPDKNPRGFLSLWHPTFSPDGQRIVFNATLEGESSNLYLINIDGSGLKRLIAEPDRSYADPKFGPDGRIVFARHDKVGGEQLLAVNDFDIWIMDPDKPHTAQRLTGSDVIPGPNILETDPSMSPDCRRVAFVRPITPVGLWNILGGAPKIHNSIVSVNPEEKFYQIALSGSNPDRVNGVPTWVDNEHLLSYRWELLKNGWRIIAYRVGDKDENVYVYDLGSPFGSEDLMPIAY